MNFQNRNIWTIRIRAVNKRNYEKLQINQTMLGQWKLRIKMYIFKVWVLRKDYDVLSVFSN